MWCLNQSICVGAQQMREVVRQIDVDWMFAISVQIFGNGENAVQKSGFTKTIVWERGGWAGRTSRRGRNLISAQVKISNIVQLTITTIITLLHILDNFNNVIIHKYQIQTHKLQNELKLSKLVWNFTLCIITTTQEYLMNVTNNRRVIDFSQCVLVSSYWTGKSIRSWGGKILHWNRKMPQLVSKKFSNRRAWLSDFLCTFFCFKK